MAKTKLFDNWTWNRTLPAPFDTLSSPRRNDVRSQYNNMTGSPIATIHPMLLSAILAYMGIDSSLSPGGTGSGAIGTQGSNMVIAEYHSRTGSIHVVVFNKLQGKFTGGVYASPASNPTVYSLKQNGNSGTALFFALMLEAMDDDEFKDHYQKLAACYSAGFPDMDEAAKYAAILCDNVYRRCELAGTIPAGISLNIPSTGNISQMTPLNLQNVVYNPANTVFGNFEVLSPGVVPTPVFSLLQHQDFVGKFATGIRNFTETEQALIPQLPDWYIIPPEVVTICKHIKLTAGTAQPMKNFMLRGEAGTGKTEGAKAIAAGLGLPYLFCTCSANSEIFDFLGQMLPDTGDGSSYSATSYPTLEDIQMDPPTAYCKLTGIYNDQIQESEVYDKLLEVIRNEAQREADSASPGQKFRYVDTPLVQAIRHGYVLEIQEPTVIANPGVLVGLNSLLDRCASITLPTGEIVKRHPDTVIVVTTNNHYAGCRDINQSVISRMNLVMDIDAPSTDIMAKRVMNVTGCSDEPAVKSMAESIHEIAEKCRETMITDGSCGVRELISWVQSYMVCGNILEASKYTVLSSVSSDPENRAEILSTCLEQKFAA